MSRSVIIALSVGAEALFVVALLDRSAWLSRCAVAVGATLLLGMVYSVVLAPP